MYRLVVTAATVFLAACAPAHAGSQFTAIYSFGDSLSDVGNAYLATGGAQPAPPYAQTPFGVFSNGPIWVQDLAAKLGLPDPLPNLLPGAHGTDYAVGGATIDALPGDFLWQIGEFQHDYPSGAPSTGLYTFSIGGNDLLGLLQIPGLTLAQMEGDAAILAAAEAGAAQTLELDGARNLLVYDVPDLGQTPFAASIGEAANGTALAKAFNADLFGDLKPLEGPNFTVYDPHIFQFMDAAIADPGTYGLTDVTDPCWTGDFGGYVDGGSVCSNPDQYLFWDAVHPTAVAQAFVAEAAFRAIPEPSTWAMMLAGLAGLGLAGARRAMGGRDRRSVRPSGGGAYPASPD